MRTKTGELGCMPFLPRSARVSLPSGTSAAGGIVGAFEHAATIIAATAKIASRMTALPSDPMLVPTNMPFPSSIVIPCSGQADYSHNELKQLLKFQECKVNSSIVSKCGAQLASQQRGRKAA
jgi:hypothetical protein